MDKSAISYDLLMRSLDQWAEPRLTDEGLVYRLKFQFLDTLTVAEVLLTEQEIEMAIAIDVGDRPEYLKQLADHNLANLDQLAMKREPWSAFSYSEFLAWLSEHSHYPLPPLEDVPLLNDEVQPHL